MTLKARLDAVMAGRAEWYQALLADVAERLRSTACELVLRAGDPMPDFVLPNAEGKLVFSDDLLALGPVVISFFRGGWCPFCTTALQSLQEAVPAIAARGATLVAISPDAAGLTGELKRGSGLSYEMLVDIDNATALRFGTVYRVPDTYRAALLSYGIDLEQRHGNASWLLPLPATFIAGRDGILCYAQASGDVTDRTEPQTILGVLQSLADGSA